MLKLLLKKQLLEIFRSYYYDAKKNKARSKAATIAYIAMFAVLMVVVLGGIFTLLSVKRCAPMAQAGMGWLYFALMGLLAVFLGVFGSVFNTYASLYLAKDNDLLLSMPIPVYVLLASRLLGVYLMGLLYSGIVILPAVIVYWAVAGVTLANVLGGVLLTALISVFVMTLSCALGWVVAKISLLKHKSFVTVVISLAFFGAYYFFYFRAMALIQELLANLAVYGAAVKDGAYPIYLFGSVGTGDAKACIIVTVFVAALFALMWALISRSFLKTATATGKTARTVYRETTVRQKSIPAALLGREFAHFGASPNYMLNCGLGTFLMPVCALLILWKGGEFLSTVETLLDGLEGSVPVMLSICLCGGYDCPLGVAGGEEPVAHAVPAGHAVAGAESEAFHADHSHGSSHGAVHSVRGGSLSVPACAASDDDAVGNVLRGADGAVRPVSGSEKSHSDMDE